MNRISAIALLAIASVAMCAGAMAQQPGVKANIPFGFSVGDTWMPAGEYTITSDSNVLMLKSEKHIVSVASLQNYDESKSGSELVFDRYDDQYFLHELLCPGHASLNVRIPASKAEKRARERAIEAKGPVSGNRIMIAAR